MQRQNEFISFAAVYIARESRRVTSPRRVICIAIASFRGPPRMRRDSLPILLPRRLLAELQQSKVGWTLGDLANEHLM